MYKHKLLILGVFTLCFLACNQDKELIALKNKGSEYRQKYDGKMNKERCDVLENLAKNAQKSPLLISLKEDTINKFPTSFYNYLRDSSGLCCDSMSLLVNNGPFNVNVFLQNSYSMDGFINGLTGFKVVVPALLNELTSNSTGALYHVNKITRHDTTSKKIGNVIGGLNYQNFGQKGYPLDTALSLDGRRAAREFPSFKLIMREAISKADSLAMSVVISDLNMIEEDPRSLTRPCAVFENIVDEASSEIRNLLRMRTDLSLLVLRLESQFFGFHYDINGNCFIDTATNREIRARLAPFKERRRNHERERQKLQAIHTDLNKMSISWTDIKSRILSLTLITNNAQLMEEINAVNEFDNSELRNIRQKIARGAISRRINKLNELINIDNVEISYLERGCPQNLINESFSRPYFIWIFGTKPQLENVLQSSFFREREYNLAKFIRNRSNAELRILDCPEYGKYPVCNRCKRENESRNWDNLVHYRINNDNGSIHIISDRNEKAKIEIPMRLNFGRVANTVPEILSSTKYYNLSDTANFEIKKLPNADVFVIESRETYRREHGGLLSVGIVPKYPWISTYSYNNDNLCAYNFVNSFNEMKTPGLNLLLGNLHTFFYEQPLVSFQIKIGGKK